MERAHLTSDKDVYFSTLSKLKTYFVIQGVTTLIGLVIGIIVFFIVGLGAVIEALT